VQLAVMFEAQTSSRSTSVSAPMPERASASAAHVPTPPMPTTQTCAARSFLQSVFAVKPRDAAEPCFKITHAFELISRTLG